MARQRPVLCRTICRGTEQLAHARRLDPLYPPLWDFYIGRALLHLGRYEEAASSSDLCATGAYHFIGGFIWRQHWRSWGGRTRHGPHERSGGLRNLWFYPGDSPLDSYMESR